MIEEGSFRRNRPVHLCRYPSRRIWNIGFSKSIINFHWYYYYCDIIQKVARYANKWICCSRPVCRNDSLVTPFETQVKIDGEFSCLVQRDHLEYALVKMSQATEWFLSNALAEAEKERWKKETNLEQIDDATRWRGLLPFQHIYRLTENTKDSGEKKSPN